MFSWLGEFALKAVALAAAVIGGAALGKFLAQKAEDVPCISLGFLPTERPWDIQHPTCSGKETIEILNFQSSEGEEQLPVSPPLLPIPQHTEGRAR